MMMQAVVLLIGRLVGLPSPLLACATVVIPALNEGARIASVVRHALADPATAQVIVVDDSSIDDTAQLARLAGAEVITSTMLGKGASMRDGVGAIVARLLWHLRCDVVAFDPVVNQGLVDLGVTYVELDDALATADIVTLNCPLNEHTHHLIDETSIAKMKPGSMLVNTF